MSVHVRGCVMPAGLSECIVSALARPFRGNSRDFNDIVPINYSCERCDFVRKVRRSQ